MNIDVMVLVVGALLLAWAIVAQRKRRLMADTPTSKVRSVAMGFAELKGKAQPLGPLISPISGCPCAHYYYIVEQEYQDRHGVTQRRVVKHEASMAPFYLDDGTGRIMVFPRKADMTVANAAETRDGDLIITEHCIMPGDQLYVAGTVGRALDFAAPAMDERAHYEAELRELKANLAAAEGDPSQWASPQAQREAAGRLQAQVKAMEDRIAALVSAPHEDPGEALAVGKGEDESDLIISTQSEEEMTSGIDTESGAGLLIGAAMVLYGVWALTK